MGPLPLMLVYNCYTDCRGGDVGREVHDDPDPREELRIACEHRAKNLTWSPRHGHDDMVMTTCLVSQHWSTLDTVEQTAGWFCTIQPSAPFWAVLSSDGSAGARVICLTAGPTAGPAGGRGERGRRRGRPALFNRAGGRDLLRLDQREQLPATTCRATHRHSSSAPRGVISISIFQDVVNGDQLGGALIHP